MLFGLHVKPENTLSNTFCTRLAQKIHKATETTSKSLNQGIFEGFSVSGLPIT